MAAEIKAQVQSKNPFSQNPMELMKKNAQMEEQMLLQQRVALQRQLSSLPPAQYTNPYGGGLGTVRAPSPERDAIEAQMQSIDSKIGAARQRASGVNPDGTPISPEWTSLTDEETGQLLDQYKLQGLDPSQWEAYQRIKQEGMRAPGQNSAWANIQLQKQGQEEAMARDAAAKQAMSGTAQAQSQLAMRGGLGSGASTSLAKDMQRQLLMQRQGVARQGIGARLDISSKDEAARQDQLGKLSGWEMDIGKANKNVEQYNLQNLLKEAEGRRAWDQEQYKEKMKAWAAEKEAQASSGGGGGGGK